MTTTSSSSSASGPLGNQILAQEADLEALGQQVQVLQESVAADVQLT